MTARRKSGWKLRPDFMCIGVQKSGTTWLYENLGSQDWFYPGLMKEVHYFDEIFLWSKQRGLNWENVFRRVCQNVNYHLVEHKRNDNASALDLEWLYDITSIAEGPIDLDWYRGLFKKCGPDQLCGDFTPEYCLLDEESIIYIRENCPDTKYVIVLRDPVSRAWSEIRMKFGADLSLETFEEYANQLKFLGRSDYSGIIERWRKVVGDDNLLVLFYDDIFDNPTSMLNDVADFLKREAQSWPIATRVIHGGRSPEMPGFVKDKLIAISQPSIDDFSGLYPDRCDLWRLSWKNL